MLQELRKDDKILYDKMRLEYGSPGRFWLCIRIKMNISGLQEWGQGSKRIEAVFQQMFPKLSLDEKKGEMSMFTKAYHNYKRKYVRHLSFNPEEQNLSMVTSID